MSSSAPKNPTILLEPSTPMWFHCAQWMLIGAGLVFLWVFYVVVRTYLQAPAPAEAFRAAAVPIVQHRLEQRVWPEDFDFARPPAGMERYDFTRVWEKASGDITVAGAWRFVRAGAEGKPAVQFEAAEGADPALFFAAVDKRIDDGKPDRGRFRVDGRVGSLTLPLE